MYKKLREIHGAVAMFFLPMLLAFAISSVDLAHRKWFAHSPSGFLAIFTRIHRSHGTLAYVAIVFSLGLLTLGGTGFYLWFRNQRERTVGIILLLFGAALALTLIISMRAS